MKVLIISDAAGHDGAQGMLRFLSNYWSNVLGWNLDVYFPRGEGFGDPILDESGLCPIPAILPGTPYDFVLINSVLNLGFLDVLKNVPLYLWVHEGITPLLTAEGGVSKWMNCFSAARRIIFQSTYQANEIYRSLSITYLPIG